MMHNFQNSIWNKSFLPLSPLQALNSPVVGPLTPVVDSPNISTSLREVLSRPIEYYIEQEAPEPYP